MTHLGSRWRVAVLGGLFIVSVVMAARKIRPFQSGSVGPDSAAPVIEFERLTAGQALEGHLTQTSKPVLDLVYGPLFDLFHDWRPIAWAAILAFALCVLLATLLAYRVGGLSSAAFAAAAFLLSPILLVDIALAYAIVWMLLFLLIAGLAVTAERPRYGVAGLALMLAALARPEALAVVGVAAVALIGAEIWAIRGDRPRPPRAAYLVLLGLLAVPVFLAHDSFLFGDPLFWAKTAQINSEGRKVRGLVAMIGWMWHHFLDQAALLPLAAIAGWVTVAGRQWTLVIGLAGVIFGIAGVFVISGARGTFVTARYLVPIDLGLLFAAAVGVSALDIPALRRWAGRRLRPTLRRSLLPLVGGLAVALAIAPMWPLDPSARAYVDKQVQLHANARRAFDAIRLELRDRPSWRGLPASKAISAHPLVIVPPTLRAQAVADLDLPLTEVAYSYSRSLNPALGLPTAGTIIYHDRLDDAPVSAPRYKLLEIDEPTIIGAYRYVPILVDAAAGFWVLRVEDAASS
jgi:hypothetical protein